MLKPFEYAVLTLEDAEPLLAHLKRTSPARLNQDDVPLFDLRQRLQAFVTEARRYQNELQDLDRSDFQRAD